jgi:hypothetical protein
MTGIREATAQDIAQAIINCYPTTYDKIYAMLYKNRNGDLPFNPRLN